MVAALAHRGPDASGVHVDDRAALGSTRLAIIDLVGGDPPIYSEDRSVCLVYNGEVYDHLAIRSRLERLGHVFASATDSEAVVHAYEEDGIGSVAALNGMFAFAIWDTRRGELHLARDRFGQKPLYYHWDGTTLVFASEIKALLASGRVPAVLDPDAMVEALTFQNIVSMRSIVRNVSMVPPGSTLKVDEHGLTITRYFDPMPAPDPAIDARETATLVKQEFTQAVERHLMSDVDVASYLSGGLDTGSIAAIASASLPRLSTFCIGFDVSDAEGLEAGFDELDDARVLAETLGTHHHDLRLDASDMEMVLPRMMRHLEEPRMNFSYPNYLAAGLTSRWVKVVLSGAGGDELFGGYPWRYAHGEGDDFPNSYFRYWNRLLTPDELRDALRPEVLEQVDLERPRAVFDEVMQESEGLPNLDRILYYEKPHVPARPARPRGQAEHGALARVARAVPRPRPRRPRARHPGGAEGLRPSLEGALPPGGRGYPPVRRRLPAQDGVHAAAGRVVPGDAGRVRPEGPARSVPNRAESSSPGFSSAC